ncbi:PREDICTED: uncharacterized protein LOC106109939 [Papilio polytes]|uniref:uncharacterized protein LOC106109939 n=1 Tax=Papilio polytes TaxID=76194 RepID=UPI0006764C0D|nr:PREDICTED: uncharacterized protein LOC106109939 [Papilio polytes]
MKYSIITFITIMALCVGILMLGPAYRFREYNALESAVFAATNRSIWAALNAAFILLCEYGTLRHLCASPPLSDRIQDSCGIVVISSIASLYMTLFIESPLNNLVGLVIETKPSTPKTIEKSETAVKSDSFKESIDEVRFVSMNDLQKDNRDIKNGIDNNAYIDPNEEKRNKDVWRQDF